MFKLIRSSVSIAFASLVAIGLSGIVAQAHAQQWPTKPVRIISVFPPGGSVDQVSRILAQQLSLQTGQQFVVAPLPELHGDRHHESGEDEDPHEK